MKKLLFLIVFLMSGIPSFSQYTWSVNPKTFTDEVGVSRTIVGIQCRFVGSVDVDTTVNKNYNLYLAFVLDDGKIFGERNVQTNDFVEKMVLSGTSRTTATATVQAILKDLQFGTLSVIKQKAAILASLYGYTLKP